MNCHIITLIVTQLLFYYLYISVSTCSTENNWHRSHGKICYISFYFLNKYFVTILFANIWLFDLKKSVFKLRSCRTKLLTPIVYLPKQVLQKQFKKQTKTKLLNAIRVLVLAKIITETWLFKYGFILTQYLLSCFFVWSNSLKIDLGFVLFCQYFDNPGPFVILRSDRALIYSIELRPPLSATLYCMHDT
jgi:hypothetical protein